MERLAWRLTRITQFWDTDYYRTYTEEPGQPDGHVRLKSSGLARDTATDSRLAFVVDDGNYLSARWPGDTHTFAGALCFKLAT
ncbi:hypothetical protein [Mycobacterium tilburgii]|uniref:hypothetical protein n=1 Tax=Mycobacterium tilburgii TaxID=44467 RepID=UPI0021B26EAF|nr:hypothetical protein [Mycobacterium tilburgii]